jgi:hypothetical protein
MVNNIYLNFDALNGDPNQDNGGVREGTTLILWEWTEGDNQRWKIVEWCKSHSLLCFAEYLLSLALVPFNVQIISTFLQLSFLSKSSEPWPTTVQLH